MFSRFSTFRARSHFSIFRISEKKTDLEVFRFSTFLLFAFFLFFDFPAIFVKNQSTSFSAVFHFLRTWPLFYSRMQRTGPLLIFLQKSDVQVFQQFSIFLFLASMNLVFVVLVLCTLTTYFSFCCRGARQFYFNDFLLFVGAYVFYLCLCGPRSEYSRTLGLLLWWSSKEVWKSNFRQYGEMKKQSAGRRVRREKIRRKKMQVRE